MKRTGVWIPFAIFVAAAIAYTAYWRVVRAEAVKIVEAQIEDWRAAGYTVDWASMSTGGYPFRVRITLEEPAMASAPGEERWSWRGERLHVHALPYRLNHVLVQPEGDFLADSARTGPLSLTSENSIASVVSDQQGVMRATLRLTRVKARRGLGGAVAAEADELRAHAQRDPEDPSRFRLYAAATEPSWDGAGADAPTAAIGDVIVERADVLNAYNTLDDRALSAWAAADGRISIVAMEVAWGEAAFSVSGRVGLERDGDWDGDLTLVARRPSEAFMRLERLGAVDARTAAQVGLLADAAAGSDGEARAPVSIRSGRVAVFGLPLGYVPPAF